MCRSIADGGRRCPGTGPAKSDTPLASAPKLSRVGVDTAPPSTASPPTSPTPESAPSLNPETENFNILLTADPKEWLARPWKLRKKIIEDALGEAVEILMEHPDVKNEGPGYVYDSAPTFDRWSQSTTTLGKARLSYYTAAPHRFTRTIELSDKRGRYAEPRTLAILLAHELAHTLAPPSAAHGETWVKMFRLTQAALQVPETSTSTHTPTDIEYAAELAAAKKKRENAPWQGTCPQGHAYARGRKPAGRYSCRPCLEDRKPATITFTRNENRGGGKK